MVIEKILILAKADVLERGLLGIVTQKLEDAGLKVVAAKLVQAKKTQAKRHYTGSKDWKTRIGKKVIDAFNEVNQDAKLVLGSENPEKLGTKIHDWSVNYLIKNPVLALVVEGPHAIERVNKIGGHTEPRKAARGTIRGNYSTGSIVHSNVQRRAIFNLVHSSRDTKSAAREIKVWFTVKEILKYTNKYERVQKS